MAVTTASALILILAAFYSASALVLVRLSFGALVGPWVRSFRGVVAPFAGAIVIIFSILVGFLANDVWDRNRPAAATVRGEGASFISLHALAAALGAPHVVIDRAIRAYAAAVIDKEWPRMENGEGRSGTRRVVANRRAIGHCAWQRGARPPIARHRLEG